VFGSKPLRHLIGNIASACGIVRLQYLALALLSADCSAYDAAYSCCWPAVGIFAAASAAAAPKLEVARHEALLVIEEQAAQTRKRCPLLPKKKLSGRRLFTIGPFAIMRKTSGCPRSPSLQRS
jgi:hypothetical protein